MTRIGNTHRLIAAGAAIGLGACSSGGSDGAFGPDDSANLSVSLMDAPVDDVIEVNLEITGLFLKAEGDGPAEELPLTETPYETDLLTLTDTNAALLVDGVEIDAGSYEWLEMEVNAEIDGSTDDSYAVNNAGEWKELFVPSRRVRLVGGFEAGPNETVELLFDWDLRSGLVHPPGLGGKDTTVYLLKPAIRVIGTTQSGQLSGVVALETVNAPENECLADDEDIDVGNAVYIYEGHDVVPDDYDEEADDVTPFAAVTVQPDEEGAYTWSTLLPEDDYTVAFTCQAANDAVETNETGNDNPDEDTVAFIDPAVNVTIDAETLEDGIEVDF